jgi:ferredoxin-NADP reductase
MDETPVTVREVRDVGPDTVAIEFETPDAFEAEPGQFVQLLADLDGEEVARFYTLSSPDVVDSFEITVAIDPDGEFGPHLASLAAGDEVTIKGPFGESHYRGEDAVVVLAGGPGIGPAVALAERALAEDGDAAIVYQDDGLVHEARLAALAAAGASVFVVHEAFDGAVSAALATVPGAVFAYGFADFVDRSKNALVATGFDVDDAQFESFGPAP